MNRLATFFSELWRRVRRTTSGDATSAAIDNQPESSLVDVEEDTRPPAQGPITPPVAEDPPNPTPGELPIAPPPHTEPARDGDKAGDEDVEEEDEDDALESADLDDEDDPLAPDPFVSPDRPTLDAPSVEDLAQRRAEAQRVALEGEHKIYLSDVAGPGTLAEALNQLLQDGRVMATFEEAEGEEAHLLYRPLPAAQGDT